MDRNELAACVLLHLQQAMQTFEQTGLASFVESWNRLDHFAGQPVKLLMGEQVIRGIARGSTNAEPCVWRRKRGSSSIWEGNSPCGGVTDLVRS